MSSFAKASKVFTNSFDLSEYFESVSASYVKNLLIRTIDENNIPLIFLLGEAGVGKTYMLNIIKESYIFKKRVLFSSEPFSTPESFLYFLLKNHKLKKNLSISELKDIAVNIYKYEDNIIIIDEAQLLNETILEFIRILSDTGHFKFIISMHKEEGLEVLNMQHFSSRTHLPIFLEKLDKNEILNYIHAQLFRSGMGELAEQFTLKQVNLIEKYSDGNFRIMKQILKHIFSIMDFAKENGRNNYTTPTKYVITMAAIDLGIIDV
ncbi:MAG: ATP-binding protein [Campylobacterota bacterium]|nr:ATP-binding protein [Campylobacterota bacterium]